MFSSPCSRIFSQSEPQVKNRHSHLSPVTNEPVHLWNIPNKHFETGWRMYSIYKNKSQGSNIEVYVFLLFSFQRMLKRISELLHSLSCFLHSIPASLESGLHESNKSTSQDCFSSISLGVLHQELINHHIIPPPMWPSDPFLIYQNEILIRVEGSTWCFFSWFWWIVQSDRVFF